MSRWLSKNIEEVANTDVQFWKAIRSSEGTVFDEIPRLLDSAIIYLKDRNRDLVVVEVHTHPDTPFKPPRINIQSLSPEDKLRLMKEKYIDVYGNMLFPKNDWFAGTRLVKIILEIKTMLMN